LDSAGSNEKRRREAERRFGEYREATVRDYRLAGDTAYNDYLIRAPIRTENNGFFISRRYAIPEYSTGVFAALTTGRGDDFSGLSI